MIETSAPLKIIKYPHDHLRVCAATVTADWEAALEFAHAMLATMRVVSGIGLAATQVCDDRRIIVIDVSGGESEPLLLANPEILANSKELNTHEEGCLSLPKITAPVERPAWVTVSAYDLSKGETVTIEATELLATCLQHEIDHLNGVLFIDLLSRLRRSLVLRKYRKVRLAQSED